MSVIKDCPHCGKYQRSTPSNGEFSSCDCDAHFATAALRGRLGGVIDDPDFLAMDAKKKSRERDNWEELSKVFQEIKKIAGEIKIPVITVTAPTANRLPSKSAASELNYELRGWRQYEGPRQIPRDKLKPDGFRVVKPRADETQLPSWGESRLKEAFLAFRAFERAAIASGILNKFPEPLSEEHRVEQRWNDPEYRASYCGILTSGTK
jgi:hypothetical protein